MKALSQSLIETLMADSNYTSAFPELIVAKQSIARLLHSSNAKSGGCCGSRSSPTSLAEGQKGVFSALKKSVATWPVARQKQLLSMLGYRALQVSYNDPKTGALKTEVLEV